MVTSKIYLYGFLIIGAGIAISKAEVDCSGPPPFVDFKTCCELSNIISDDIREKCNNDQEEHGPPDNRRGPKHHHGPHNKCFFTCVVNETGILEDGELQEDNINSYLNEVFDDFEKVELVRNQLMTCHEKHKEFQSKMPEGHHHGPHHGPPHCSPRHGGMLIGCAHMELFKNCPDSYWSDSDECNDARDHFAQCKPPHHGPHRHEVMVEEEDI